MMRRTKGETRAQQAERIRQNHEWLDDMRDGQVRLTPTQYRTWQAALGYYWQAGYGEAHDAALRELRSMGADPTTRRRLAHQSR